MKQGSSIKVLAFLTGIGVFGSCTPGWALDCKALYSYRDNQLVGEYDKASKKYIINTTAISDLRKIKSELEDTALWHTSDLGHLKDVLLISLKTTIDLFSNLLELNPETGLPIQAVDASKTTAQYILQGLKAGQTIQSLAENGIGMTVLEHRFASGGPLQKLTVALINLSKNVKDLSEAPEQRELLRTEINSQMDRIDGLIAKYNEDTTAAQNNMSEVNNVREAIDKACASPWKGTWSGEGGGDGGGFGQPPYCNYNISVVVDNIELTIDENNSVVSGGINAHMVETLRSRCPYPPLGRRTLYFNLTRGHVVRDNVSAYFAFDRQSNGPRSSAALSGDFDGDILHARVVIDRLDGVPAMQWEVQIDQPMRRTPE